jgi:hypothetical protein
MTPEISLAWWHMPITPAPRRLRQEEQGQPICIASSRPAWTVQQDPISKQNQNWNGNLWLCWLSVKLHTPQAVVGWNHQLCMEQCLDSPHLFTSTCKYFSYCWSQAAVLMPQNWHEMHSSTGFSPYRCKRCTLTRAKVPLKQEAGSKWRVLSICYWCFRCIFISL